MGRKKVTSSDVAAASGVSQATVSMILNRRENVSFSRETVEKVEAAAKELGYQIPRRKMRRESNGNKLIVVFCPTLTNPYYVMLLRGIEEVAKEKNYGVFVCNTQRDLKIEENYLRMMKSVRPRGIIYTCNPSRSCKEKVEELAAEIPLVIINNREELLEIDAVELNNAKPGRLMARHLLELGQASRALRQRVVQERRQRHALEDSFDLRGMVWQDPATERVVHLACQVARADVPVLISGPNGSGKEHIAAIVQANSQVAGGPFVVLNCGAVPVDLIEAELFGAEAGAYTGSTRARDGKFDAADGGTLFLDEIGNLPLAGQMKLLRVLETGRFERLGSNRERQVKVRVISASNADLPAMIKAGTFREDLFYRLNVIELRLPPLAQRPLDILVLARHFLGSEKTLDAQAQATLLAHGWPGNVRELKNVMQRASLLTAGSVIHAQELGLPQASAPALRTPPDPAGAEPDRDSLVAALARAHGVVAQAAQDLGLSRQALYRRMERLGIARS